ncbi:MAG: RuBisCO large subunit C-terminal-like domain-containing protein [Balneolaceae bacterium]
MSGQNTFWVQYQIEASDPDDAQFKATQISIEQSVEMPPDVVPASSIHNIAEVQNLEQVDDHYWNVTIHFNTHLVDGDPTQFINVLFGNISLQPWCKLIDADSNYISGLLNGPYFGIKGIRQLVKVQKRALSCAVIKPIGSSAVELAEMAFQFTQGGIDIIKDDHGLTNQKSAPFEDRVKRCLEAIRKGEQISGKKTLYFSNITTAPTQIIAQYKKAVRLGVDGVLVAPQLVGLETMHELSKLGDVPIMAHPTFSGSYLVNQSGIDPVFYFGKLIHAFGADAIIYPNADGRFSFSTETCKAINRSCQTPIKSITPAFPAPGGGVKLNTIPGLVEQYGNDIIFLIGGSLYKHPEGLRIATQKFQQALRIHEE